jgi:hypothetical protein
MTKNSLWRMVITNTVSGLSLITIIVFGAFYLQFKNTPIYENYKIEITNNPITGNEDIEFAMVGRKVLDCQAEQVYGIATSQDGTKEVVLDQFTKTYMRNVTPGLTVTNNWAFARPPELTPGLWRVDMVGHWHCRFFIFSSTETIRNHENILLVVK